MVANYAWRRQRSFFTLGVSFSLAMDFHRLPPLTAIRAFTAAAEGGSIVAAAEKLNVTHSAVSHQVRAIELSLGCKLFDRHPTGVTLTEAGKRLWATTAPALEAIGSVCAAIRGQGPSTPVTLACPGSFMMQWLIPRLDGLESSHPNITLNLQVATELGWLRAGHVDALIYCGRETLPADVSEQVLAANDIGPICSPLLAGVLQTPGDIAAMLILATDSYPAAWDIWADAHGLDAGQLTPRRSFAQLIYMIQATIANLGVGIAPSILVREEMALGRVVAPLGFVSSGDRISLCVMKRRSAEPALLALAAWLGDTLLARGDIQAPGGSDAGS